MGSDKGAHLNVLFFQSFPLIRGRLRTSLAGMKILCLLFASLLAAPMYIPPAEAG